MNGQLRAGAWKRPFREHGGNVCDADIADHFLPVLVRSISASMARRRIAFIRVW